MATHAQARLREDAPDVRWVLFIGGIPIAFSTDNGQGRGGSILGTGASSWIGLSETAIGGVEVAGARTVRSGLEMPSTWTDSVDVKSGDIEPNSVVFRLHDDDEGTLAALFSREDKPFDILRERLPPGTAALPATALGQGGGSINISGRNIGIERAGAAGQRRLFPALPESLVGFDHTVHQDAEGPGSVPPIKVSDDPLQWAGRLVTLYAVYRDPDSTATDASAWYTWDEQDLRWFGKLIAQRRQKGRVYELQCHGRDGLYRKQLGRVSSSGWQQIVAERNRSADDSGFAVIFERRGDPGTAPTHFNGSIFDTDLTGATKNDIIAEIDSIISDAVDGTDVNYTPGGGDLDAWEVVAVNQEADCGIEANAQFWCRKKDQATDQFILVMFVVMHSRDWRQLGFEPESQHFDNMHNATEGQFQIQFARFVNGQELRATFDTGFNIPGDGYFMGRFTTVAVGGGEYSTDNTNDWDNDGHRRYYEPKFKGEPFTLELNAANQIIRLLGGESPFIEGQLSVFHSGDDVDGSAGERARYFALRGQVARLEVGSGGALVATEPEPTIQVARFEWNEGNYGNINPGTGAQPTVILTQWLDPRTFGFNHKPLDGLEFWTGVSGQGADGRIEAAPMSAYAYQQSDNVEFAYSLWSQILLSSGSGGGYTGLVLDDGDNAPASVPAALFFGSDIELADMGCAVPASLVDTLANIKDAFATTPSGSDGPLNRCRYAYMGPYLAQDALASLMRPRRLIWRLHGDVLSVIKLAPFSASEVEVTITEDDIYAESEDPRSLEPDQAPNPAGYLDGVALSFRWDPSDASTVEEQTVRAQDAEASARTGELVEGMEDHGLIAFDWGVPIGVGTNDWREDFRQLWAFDAAEFFSLDHFSVTLKVSRPKGQDLRPGTKVLLSNPWPANNAGTYGIVNHVGIVTATTVDPRTHAVDTEVFVFAGQAEGIKHFAPMARILDQAGAVLTLSTDQYGHGDALIADTDGFVEPSWSSVGGDAVVQVLIRIGETWTLGTTHDVVSFNSGTSEITLDGTPDTSVEYADRWLLLVRFDTQNANEFARTIFGAIVEDDLTHGAGPTTGRAFLV